MHRPRVARVVCFSSVRQAQQVPPLQRQRIPNMASLNVGGVRRANEARRNLPVGFKTPVSQALISRTSVSHSNVAARRDWFALRLRGCGYAGFMAGA